MLRPGSRLKPSAGPSRSRMLELFCFRSSSARVRAVRSWRVAGGTLLPTRVGRRALEQDLGRGLRLAALPDELDGGMEIRLAVRELLGERERIAGLDQSVQAPARDLLALALVVFGNLSHVAPGREIRPFFDEPCPLKVRH